MREAQSLNGMMADGRSDGWAGDSCNSSRGILSSLENVDIARLRPQKRDAHLSYPWCIPRGRLGERRALADQRREQLLDLLYRDSLQQGQVEALVREWISLVVERDKIVREELDQLNSSPPPQENDDKVEYIRGMRRLLRSMPELSDNSEEVNLRDTLLDLEKQISDYCCNHNIGSPPNAPSPLTTAITFQSLPPVSARLATQETDRVRLQLSEESSESTTPICASPSKENGSHFISDYNVGGGPSSLPARLGKLSRKPAAAYNRPALSNGKDSNRANGSKPLKKNSSYSPPPPPPPPPPPLPSSMGGVRGTGQFIDARAKTATSSAACDEPDCASKSLQSNVLAEIASKGQRGLRRTSRARSPGGTPLKGPRRVSGSGDMLQRALLHKFQNLNNHSTPVRNSCVSSFEVSSVWSDINSSVDYADPDITASELTSDLLQNTSPVSQKTAGKK